MGEVANREELEPSFRPEFFIVDKFKWGSQTVVKAARYLVDHIGSVTQSKVPTFPAHLFSRDECMGHAKNSLLGPFNKTI